MRKRAGWILAGAVLLSALGLTALWFRFRPPPAVEHRLKPFDSARGLSEFVSAPLDSAGTRIRLLLPSGWEVASIRPDHKTAARRPKLRHAHVIARLAAPTRAPSGSLQKLIPRTTPQPQFLTTRDFIEAQILPFPTHKPLKANGVERVLAPGPPPGWTVYQSYREWRSNSHKEPLLYTLRFHCQEYGEFKRTHDAVSFGFRLQ